MTGQRLKDLGFKYSILVNSTMKRAVETADIISAYLPDVPREDCCMLREGAPIVPEPPSAKWRPEDVVSTLWPFFGEKQHIKKQICKIGKCLLFSALAQG